MTRASYRGFRFPKPIIGHAVWLYARFITVSDETIGVWVARFGPQVARRLRRQRGRPTDPWHLDETPFDSCPERLARAMRRARPTGRSRPYSAEQLEDQDFLPN